MTQIECTIRRANGTRVLLGSTTYDFQPEHDGGPHLCHVEDEDHISALMAVPESFRIAQPAEPDIATVRRWYEERVGKRPYSGWTIAQILERMGKQEPV